MAGLKTSRCTWMAGVAALWVVAAAAHGTPEPTWLCPLPGCEIYYVPEAPPADAAPDGVFGDPGRELAFLSLLIALAAYLAAVRIYLQGRLGVTEYDDKPAVVERAGRPESVVGSRAARVAKPDGADVTPAEWKAAVAAYNRRWRTKKQLFYLVFPDVLLVAAATLMVGKLLWPDTLVGFGIDAEWWVSAAFGVAVVLMVAFHFLSWGRSICGWYKGRRLSDEPPTAGSDDRRSGGAEGPRGAQAGAARAPAKDKGDAAGSSRPPTRPGGGSGGQG